MPDNKIERRAHQGLELRQEGDGPPQLVGMPVVYNSESVDLGGFVEIVRPGAFGNLADHDVRALVDHDPSLIIGRTKPGTLELRDTKAGLQATIAPPDTQTGRDVMTSVKRGDLDGMSFGFFVREQRWTLKRADDPDALDLREILSADLFDVSVVAYPAYPDTTIAARSRDAALSEELDVEARRIGLGYRSRDRFLRLHELEARQVAAGFDG